MSTRNPFERGRSPQAIRDSIHASVGDDYPLLGLILELESAIEREARNQALAAVRAAVDEVEAEHHDLFGHDDCEFDEAVLAIRSAILDTAIATEEPR